MSTLKPVIKLPPRTTTSDACNNNRINFSKANKQTPGSTPFYASHPTQEIVVSNELFFEDPDNTISDYDIQNVLRGFKILQIRREAGGGYLSFLNASAAERAYTLFNGYVFAHQIVLRFRLHPTSDLQPEGDIWEISNLPLHLDHNALYDIFRPFGPLSICKLLIENSTSNTAASSTGAIGHEGKALIQYFFKSNSDSASVEMNGKLIDGNRIQFTLLLMNSKHSQQPSMHHTSGFNNHQSNSMIDKREGSFVDYMNLYVKNLDPTVDNNDLFNLFRKFGRIVSARIMTNPQNGQSKGYGFVSFGNPEEAAAALAEMNGYQFRTKPIIVAYHEPKKPRQIGSTSTATSLFNSSPPATTLMNGNAASFTNVSSATASHHFDMKHPHDVMGPLNGLGIDHVDQLSMSIKLEDSSVGTTNVINSKPQKSSTAILTPNSYSSPPNTIRSTPNTTSSYFQHSQQPYRSHNARPSLASLASGASIQQPPSHTYYQQQQQQQQQHSSMYDHMKQIEEEMVSEQQSPGYQTPYAQRYTKIANSPPNASSNRPSLRRKGSSESINSIMTESTAQVQRHRMTEAVKRCCMETPALMMIVTNQKQQQQQQQINDIVDMLLTLNKKERSICLFNRDFLKEKVLAAVEALEICDEDIDEVQDEQHLIDLSLPGEATSTTILTNDRTMDSVSGIGEILTSRPIASPPLGLGCNDVYNTAAAGPNTIMPNPSYSNTTNTTENVIIPPRKSKAIPIVAPPHLDTAKQAETRALLDSLEGKPIHEKKQQLGDQLFPLVKATGVRHAPRITIRLLDTIELEILAKIMYDKEALKAEVEKASAAANM